MRLKNIVLLFLFAGGLSAQTIRPDHWLMEEARFYWNRGFFWDLSPQQRPLTLQELGQALSFVESDALSPALGFFNRLAPACKQDAALVWINLDNAVRDDGKRTCLHTIQRAGAGIKLNSSLQLFGSFYIDNQLDADSSYLGERQSGYAAFMEQAYLRGQWNRFIARFGRDYLVWGPGVDASLHLSAYSRPMDHIFLSWSNSCLQLSFFTASLDRTAFPVDGQESVQNRYLSGHRIEARLLPFLRLGVSETALFGGPDAGIDLAFLNPLLLYTGVEQNGPQKANVMASVDATILLRHSLNLYGSFLIDDFQFESKTADDRGEPAELGWLSGLNWADPFGAVGVDLFAEYTRVTNRTYNGQGGPWEKYLHRNRSLGHFLGNDFDRAVFGVRYRPNSKLHVQCRYEHRRHGEGRINNPFDMPWRQVPQGETYTEPFPTGIVESENVVQLGCRWQPFYWLGGDFYLAHHSMTNRENQAGLNARFWQFRLNVALELVRPFLFF